MSSAAATESAPIWILGIEDTTDRGLISAIEARYQRGKVSATELRDRVGEFLDSMQPVLERVPNALGDFKVDAITLKIEITAKGKVSLCGTGGELAGTGGLTLSLKRA